LNREYLTHRNAQMKARAEMAAREAALRDGTLHESKRCEQIVGHYLTLMRQRLLWIPARVRAQWRQPDLTEFVRDEIYSALTELSELPEAVATGRVTDYVIDPIMPNGGDGNGNGDAVEPGMIRRASRKCPFPRNVSAVVAHGAPRNVTPRVKSMINA
jgi:hypothetical protein